MLPVQEPHFENYFPTDFSEVSGCQEKGRKRESTTYVASPKILKHPALILYGDIRNKAFKMNRCDGFPFISHGFKALIRKFAFKSTDLHLFSLIQWHLRCDFAKILI